MPVTVRGTDILFNNSTTQNTVGTIVRGANTSTSGTNIIDFTGIPSGVTRVCLIFYGVSTTSAANNIWVQLGTSSSFITTGYNSSSGSGRTSITTSAATEAFHMRNFSAAMSCMGQLIISRLGSTNTWVANGNFGDGPDLAFFLMSGGVDIGAELTRVRLTTSGGANYDAGSVSIIWEY